MMNKWSLLKNYWIGLKMMMMWLRFILILSEMLKGLKVFLIKLIKNFVVISL